MSNMKRLAYFILIFCFFCTTLFADTQPVSAQLVALLNQFITLKANFTQTTVDLNQQILQNSNGTVILKRPGHFRWETMKPTHQIVITNDNTVWIYDVDLKQATKQSLQNLPINPATLLSGHIDTLLKQFTVHLIPHHNIMVFQLMPKTPNNAFRSVALVFANSKLKSMHIENNMGQTTVFDFSNVIFNSVLSADLFHFSAPQGVDVLQ